MEEEKKENQYVTKVPFKEPAHKLKNKKNNKENVTERVASILLIIGVMVLIISALPIVSFIFVALYYLILIAVMFLTLFTLLANEQFRNLFSGGNQITDVINAVLPAVPFIMLGSTLFFVTATILYIVSKPRSSRIIGMIFSIILAVISVVGAIIMFNI